ncbi:PIN domain-containing protein [Cellulomonas fimi]|uniref:Ribonuclease VapC n=1 Tax=Cellulomonas fimi (strain ATCC 484 / DSM 20113 / JCM 1341 / CCUG 24087 / LMG 16345 / NBRC 15513 / NCIMB 8980 / NCTC 7547 / NRS-133) TaxID=590998 RepID=F4H7A4_CELFA|nr:PIN domain-containing protein [Cellulomonas fimi]AEE46865.1 PilT protein domain protein [Cellulomonas fimi ATCC 484]NNH06408.1 PIN domain-containing protein [Cellulomonas fimi]VEH34406.1 Probable ribonuclease VapC4 [Cellulomonas fimi]
MILLDTNVLIDLHLYRFEPDETYGASILSRAELEFGVNAAPTDEAAAERLARLHDLDAVFDWLEFDKPSTRSYGIVAHRARATGARVRGKDALIAAQAHRHAAPVMTANVDDFAPFSHLVSVLRPTLL